MFTKLKNFCLFKKEKSKDMPDTTTTTTTRTNRQLKKQIQTQNDEIQKLRNRVSELRDDIAVMNRTIVSFQDKVQQDMTTVFDGLKSLSER
jgi:predicted RNase H-like nuclease (RuvC/YqgF family)